MTDNVSDEQLRQSVEQWERLEAEKADLTETQKDIMSELKAKGYDAKVVRKIIAMRKLRPDDLAEQEAVLEVYKSALGML